MVSSRYTLRRVIGWTYVTGARSPFSTLIRSLPLESLLVDSSRSSTLLWKKDQTCGVPGRFIGGNVAFLRVVVDYATLSGAPVAVLSLDQEKAFYRVEWSFMRQTLQAMGFGGSFISWVSEVLAVSIRANPRIWDLSLPWASTPLSPISQYADDTSIIVTTDDAIIATFETYSILEKGSGWKLNLSKSKGLYLDSWSRRQDPPVSLDRSSIKIKVLLVLGTSRK